MADRTVRVRYQADTADLVSKSAAAGASVKGAFAGADEAGRSLHQTTQGVSAGLGATQQAAIGLAGGLSQADAAAGRYVDAGGRMREANGRFVAGAGAATTATAALGDSADQTGRQVGGLWSILGDGVAPAEAVRRSVQGVGIGLLAIGAAATVGVGTAVGMWSSFDQQMSHIQAATHESAAGMGILSDATLAAGQASQFSATQAGEGVESLAKAGLATADIVGGALKGSLDLAAAGGLAVADSAETMATALSVFNLEGGEASHVADLLAAGAGKAQGSVADMTMALNQSALVANQMGLSVEDTTGILAEFANAGLLGSDAGTSFRTMLLRLINPSVEASDAMRQVGLNVYDASGQFVGMESIAGQLQARMGGLDEETRNAALATIFGADAIRGATILYNDGASGVEQWRDAVSDAGYASETAALMTDNLAGDVERMGGSFETAMIKIGSSADGPLRMVVQLLTDVFDTIGSAPAGVQQAILIIGGLTAAIGLAGGTAVIAAPKIIAFNTAIAAMKADTATAGVQRLGGALGLLGRAVPIVGTAFALGAVAIGAWSASHAEAQRADEDLRSSLDQTTGAITDQTRAMVAQQIQSSGMLDLAREIGVAQGDLTDAILGDEDAIRRVSAAIEGIKEAWRVAYQPGGEVTDELRYQLQAALDLEGAYPQLAGRLQEQIEAQKAYAAELRGTAEAGTVNTTTLEGIAEAASGVATAYGEVGPAAGEAGDAQESAGEQAVDILDEDTDAVLDLIDAYNELYDINKSAPEALGAYHEAVRDTSELIGEMTEAVDANGEAVDTSAMSVQEIISAYGGLSGVLNQTSTDFDVTTEAGYALRQSFDDQGRAAQESAERTLEYNRSLAGSDPTKLAAANRTYVESLEASRASMSLSLQALGLNKTAADTLAASIVAIPDQASTKVDLEDQEFDRKEKAAKRRLDDLERLRVAKLDADDGQLNVVLAEQEGRLSSFEIRRTAQLFGDPTGIDSTLETTGGALDEFESGRSVSLTADETEIDAALARQETALAIYQERRTVQLFGDDEQADATEDDQEDRLGEFVQTRTVPLHADDAHADSIEDDQAARQREFERLKTVQLAGNDSHADAIEDQQAARHREFERMKTAILNADPSRAISGAAAAQAAINGLHGKTVFMDLDWRIGNLPEGIERATGGYAPAEPGGRHYILGEGGEGEWIIPESKMVGILGDAYEMGRAGQPMPDTNDLDRSGWARSELGSLDSGADDERRAYDAPTSGIPGLTVEASPLMREEPATDAPTLLGMVQRALSPALDALARYPQVGQPEPAAPRGWDGAQLDASVVHAATQPMTVAPVIVMPESQGKAPDQRSYSLTVTGIEKSSPIDVLHREWRTYADLGRG